MDTGLVPVRRTRRWAEGGAVAAFVTGVGNVDYLVTLFEPPVGERFHAHAVAVAHRNLHGMRHGQGEQGNVGPVGADRGADVADQIALEGTDGGIEIQPVFRAAFRQGRTHDAGGLPDAQSVEIRPPLVGRRGCGRLCGQAEAGKDGFGGVASVGHGVDQGRRAAHGVAAREHVRQRCLAPPAGPMLAAADPSSICGMIGLYRCMVYA